MIKAKQYHQIFFKKKGMDHLNSAELPPIQMTFNLRYGHWVTTTCPLFVNAEVYGKASPLLGDK